MGWLVKTIRQEGEKPGIAVSSSFVLVEWCSLIIQNLAGSALWEEFGTDIILADAVCIERCLRPTSKKTLALSAKVVTRRAFRKLFQPSESSEKTLATTVNVLAIKSPQSTARNTPLLGLVAGVASRLQSLRPAFEKLKPLYFDFYIREVIGSKIAVEEHVAAGLQDFFCDFSTLDEVGKEIIPALEKGLLRAPEVILTGVLIPLVSSLPTAFDLAFILKDKLLKPLLSNIKSSNASVRNASVQAFGDLVLRCRDPAALESIADDVLSPLKSGKLSAADHRILHSEMIQKIPLSSSSVERVATGLAAVSGKEGNEAALSAETAALAQTIIKLAEKGDQIPKLLVDTLAKGLAEKKAGSRKIWLLRVGDILLKQGALEATDGTQSLVESLIPKMVENFNEVKANAPSAAQNGLIIGAYILMAVSPGLRTRYPESKILARTPKPTDLAGGDAKEPALLSHRFYSRLSGEEDLRWMTLTLANLAPQMDDKTGQSLSLAWSEALVYLVTTLGIHPRVQQQASSLLSDLHSQRPRQTSSWIISALWSLLTEPSGNAKEAKFGRQQLIQVLKSICPKQPHGNNDEGHLAILENQACELLVLAQPVLVPRSSWIALCLRMQIDPGELASKSLDKLMGEISARISEKVS